MKNGLVTGAITFLLALLFFYALSGEPVAPAARDALPLGLVAGALGVWLERRKMRT